MFRAPALAPGVAVLALAALLGCSTTLGLLHPPRRLLDKGRAAIEANDLETAYDHLAEIRTRYPESAECREAFGLAAAILHKNYYTQRYQEPEPRWVVSEPRFMLEWFASYFPTEEFPAAEARALFIGMHYGFFRDLALLAATRPELGVYVQLTPSAGHRPIEAVIPAKGWRMRASKDNGIVESLEFHPLSPPEGESVAGRE